MAEFSRCRERIAFSAPLNPQKNWRPSAGCHPPDREPEIAVVLLILPRGLLQSMFHHFRQWDRSVSIRQ